MKIKENLAEHFFDLVNVLLLCLLMVITIYPLLYVLFASFSAPKELVAHSGLLYKPVGFTISTYRTVLTNQNIINSYKNTIFIVFAGIIVSVIMTALAAYVLSRKNVLWNKFFTLMIIFTMFFSGGMIPFYMVVNGLGLRNSLWSCILPFAVNTFNLILMRTYLCSIPDSMEESAKLDGASHIVILFRVIIPLSLPIIAVMILYYGVEKWNAWFWAAMLLKDRSKYPLQVILREILLINDTNEMTISSSANDKYAAGESVKYATIMVATLPILLLYPLIQKYFVKGVMIGALKG